MTDYTGLGKRFDDGEYMTEAEAQALGMKIVGRDFPEEDTDGKEHRER